MSARQTSSKIPRIPEVLQEIIEAERGNLAKADSILACLILAMEYGPEAPPREGGSLAPYYPDVARIARDLVRGAIHRLDALYLQQRLERDKIAEPDGLAIVPCCPAHVTVVEMRRREPEPESGASSGTGSSSASASASTSASTSTSGNERRPRRLPRLRLHRRLYRSETSSTGARAASASANISG